MFSRIFCKNCHDQVCCCTKVLNRPDSGLLLIRIALAAVFVIHGFSKLQNIGQTADFFATMGLGIFWVYLVGIVEFIGGISLFLGIMVREVSIVLALIMLFAIFLAKRSMGFVGGYEFEFLLFFVLLGLSMMGCGKCAVNCCKENK